MPNPSMPRALGAAPSAPALMPFSFNGHELRAACQNGDPWFVLTDVARAVGVKNAADIAARLDDDEKGVVLIDTLGGRQSVTMVSESGFYAAVLRSRKPATKRFRRWVTAEVIPAIRKTGGYGAPDLNDPATLRRLLAQLIQDRLQVERLPVLGPVHRPQPRHAVLPIDTNIRMLPTRSGSSPKYPWRTMAVNDSFFAPDIKANNLSGSVRYAASRTGFQFRTRVEGNGVRVWRVA